MRLENHTTRFHEWLVDLRRHFHQYPELAYEEEKTAGRIVEVLSEMGVPHRKGIGKTGVVAFLKGAKAGPTVAFRADMDALPLEEQNDVPYKSKHPGIMHACGHDGHITIALGVVRWLLENGWTSEGRGKILFFFQPAEEGGAGARAMLDSGILDSEPVEAIFAGHMHPELPAGHIGVAKDVSNAASSTLRIHLKGKGGHGAHPHLCIDPIVAGAYLVTEFQSIISRCIPATESAVLTIGRFHAGTASNIIPEEAVLEGTLRTLNPGVRESIVSRLEAMVRGLEMSHRVTAELMAVSGYPLLVNDPRLVNFTMERAGKVLGDACIHLESPRMGAEDFAYFLQKCPGVLVRLGCHNPEQGFTHGLHSPHFDFDERALDVGVRLFAHLLTAYGTSGRL